MVTTWQRKPCPGIWDAMPFNNVIITVLTFFAYTQIGASNIQVECQQWVFEGHFHNENDKYITKADGLATYHL